MTSSFSTDAMLDNVVGVSDMCLLDPLDEDTFLENLKLRFRNAQIYFRFRKDYDVLIGGHFGNSCELCDLRALLLLLRKTYHVGCPRIGSGLQLYPVSTASYNTYIGNVVISVNPYKKLPIYGNDAIANYRNRNIYELPPHIYAVADDAYRSMRDLNMDQCVIISGESGSGKTEASKVIMQYVAAVSGKGVDIDRVKEQLLKSNPVLEAFGNAKTNRNDNSSRFGKYMDIEFDFKGDPIGGVITNYLLEKSRVIVQSRGERNFHIFYQLLSGADVPFLKILKLIRNPEQYAFLRASGCTQVDGIDDRENFLVTRQAMEVLGFSRDELTAVFQLIAAVLKLGNVQFQHRSNIDGTDGCRLLNEEEVVDVCELLSGKVSILTTALTQRTVSTNLDNVRTDLSSTDATYARDALCKAVYSRLLTWLVNRINESIQVTVKGKRKSMGVLDIYGFEIFELNSFEQFIINYCNEKLQQIFIELTLKEEQDEYINEGIEWINVDYFNNAIICDLIEKNNTGILAMLDEECLRPGEVSDITFLNKLNQLCSKHAHFESRGCRKTQSDRTLPHDAFRLVHYAGTVTYKVSGFLDKNSDLLFRDLSRVMYDCNHMLLKTLFPEGNPQQMSLKRPPTAGSQFKLSVGELMKNLLSKAPNYIRCIKPNDYKRPDTFVEELVRHQVRYLGLLENVRVRRAGYAYRQHYAQFLYRYKMLCAKTWPMWRGGSARDGVSELFNELAIDRQEYAFGITKIFIRNPQTLFALESKRRQRLHVLATTLQKIYKGWYQRKKFLLLRRSQIAIAAIWRGYWAQKEYQRIRHAALVMCCYTRGWKARKILREMREHRRRVWAAAVIQKFYAGWRVRRQYRHKFRAIAGPKLVRFMLFATRKSFLLKLAATLPRPSPVDDRWPKCPKLCQRASELLRVIHHRWRCRQYRLKCDQAQKDLLREKATASDIFKGKKASYPKSVPHPFRGDYVELRQNSKWKKVAYDTNDQHLVFADFILKVNRKNGKMVNHLFVLSTNALLILDQRTLVIKYRIPVTELERISLSPYIDSLVIFHIRKTENGDVLLKKGDFILFNEHVIEIVSKVALVYQNVTGRLPQIHIEAHVKSTMKSNAVDVVFQKGHADVPEGSVKIRRKSNKLDVLQT